MKRITLLFASIIPWMIGGVVFGQNDIRKHPSCSLGGMDRHKYAHSRMLIEYAENITTGTCSIHCAAGEISVNRDKTMLSVRVADDLTKKLIPAEEAFWVIGGAKWTGRRISYSLTKKTKNC